MAVNYTNYDNCEWGREIIVGFGDCGFVILPLIDGKTPESLVVDIAPMHTFFGDKAVVEAHFAELVKLHVGKPAGLLALFSEAERKYQDSWRDDFPEAAAKMDAARAERPAAREVGSDPCNMD